MGFFCVSLDGLGERGTTYSLVHLVNVLIIHGLFLNMNLSLPKMKLSEPGLKCDNDDDSDNSQDKLIRIAEEPKEKWDCESILSEYYDCSSISEVIKKSSVLFFKVITCSEIVFSFIKRFYR